MKILQGFRSAGYLFGIAPRVLGKKQRRWRWTRRLEG